MSRRTVPALAGIALAVCLVLAGLVVVGLVQRTGPAAVTPAGTSVATGWFQVYFTTPLIPDDKSRHSGGLDTQLVALIDRAQQTLDVADYDFDLANVAAALVRPKERGVVVRMVTDSDTIEDTKNQPVQAALNTLQRAGIPIIGDGRGAIMHDKFTVVDRTWVATGSWNYTDGDTYRLNNNLVILRSPELAANYTTEFEKMFVQRRFGPSKTGAPPYPILTIDGSRVQNYFAPQDDVAAKVIATVNTARSSIYFLAFSFTHDGIGDAIIARRKAGLTVAGVFETTGSETRFSEYGRMKAAGLEVYQDGSPYVMHHKVILLDERTVIFGSFNFTDSADKSNDENLLIIENAEMARAFKAEFDRVLALAKNPPPRAR